MGNTPTGVGKTGRQCKLRSFTWKHPHGRGEDLGLSYKTNKVKETPPRAWGRRSCFPSRDAGGRNTPTGVGKTPTSRHIRRGLQKHPHGRGEDGLPLGFLGLYRETPPRAWGRLDVLIEMAADEETPPRAWGRPHQHLTQHVVPRNTPTGVGKTAFLSSVSHLSQKHPHGRGEDVATAGATSEALETPPRAWGRLDTIRLPAIEIRNTPTGVGKTI